MAVENEPGVLENFGRQLAAHADALTASAAARLREKAAEFREAVGPDKPEPGANPERPFGRDEGGEDVKQVVWTGHMVETQGGQRYYGAAGLTESGYYRAAEVQVYGSDELWRWQPERHADREDAVACAEKMTAGRLPGETPGKLTEPAWREFFGKEQSNMALPDHVKALADQARQESGMEKVQPTNVDVGTPINDRADPYDTKALEVQRGQQRQNAVDRKGPETPEPDR
jgi:hypothetical protein